MAVSQQKKRLGVFSARLEDNHNGSQSNPKNRLQLFLISPFKENISPIFKDTCRRVVFPIPPNSWKTFVRPTPDASRKFLKVCMLDENS
jgi:hypothetical protein